ncbi:uncharacterized protein DFL_009459 [Arthrobotrys flagrans]|uniref:Uncharacterized protein n=1 Tax=Arthrobotrys flagrans TaxID=97331 RepID=A0A436ZRZ9_ARTFL|nr:hypothetical protein DFL_009459 [Arthrobotrys flagrans]
MEGEIRLEPGNIFYRKSTDEMRRNVVKNEGFFLDQKAGSCDGYLSKTRKRRSSWDQRNEVDTRLELKIQRHLRMRAAFLTQR